MGEFKNIGFVGPNFTKRKGSLEVEQTKQPQVPAKEQRPAPKEGSFDYYRRAANGEPVESQQTPSTAADRTRERAQRLKSQPNAGPRITPRFPKLR